MTTKTSQQLDGIRTLAIKLFEAGESEKRKQPPGIWRGMIRHWSDLPSESVAVWDAIALCAYRQIEALVNLARAVAHERDVGNNSESTRELLDALAATDKALAEVRRLILEI